MKRKTIGILVLGIFVFGAFALPNAQPAQADTSTGCINITNNLFIGSRDYYSGGDVTKLQIFLQARGYLYTAPSGYFGYMTMAAVRSFQSSQGILSSGYVGPLTRAAITRISCGGTVPPVPPTNTLHINSLSPSSGVIGTTVTINGTGFTSDNTINFGNGAIMHVSSSNGTTLTFTVPSYLNAACYYSYPSCLMPSQQVMPGSYNVTVQNGNGTSNPVQFTVTSNPPSTQPAITSLSPSSGSAGTIVTINGSGFYGNNTVYFGGSIVSATASSNGQMLSFTVPEYITPCGPGMYCTMMARLVTPGNYDVKVINNTGTSNSVNFTVTSTNPGTTLQINSLNPTSGQIGQTVTVQGSGFDATNNIVHFGNGAAGKVSSTNNGTLLTFTVPSRIDPVCYYSNPQCMTFAAGPAVTPGTYAVSIETPRGMSNALQFTVTDNGTSGLHINSISPTSGAVGTSVTINGSGFSGSNTIYFGGSSIGTFYSSNSSVLTFTVPQYISPYCAPGYYCAQYMRQVTPGTYDVRVQNNNATSNTVQFTVTDNVTGGGEVRINGLDAPSYLRVGQSGTWTVRVQNTGGQLNYSVRWGDEGSYAAASNASSQTVVQSQATFSHTYNSPGTYYPVFTVTSGNNSATASANVNVGY